MRVASLEAYGVSENVISAVEREHGGTLLPVQERAVRECGVLEGRDLLVFAPTSAGKTLIAELAALRAVGRGAKAVLAMPTRSLVEEKVEALLSAYGSAGLRVVAGTRDRREHDAALRRLDYDVAVVVYEKLAGLLASSPTYLDNISVLALDELQMLRDPARGWDIQWVLHAAREHRRLAPVGPQIIGLSAALGEAEATARALGLPVLVSSSRPVPLRSGVVYNGHFHYRDGTSGAWDRETLIVEPPREWEWLEGDERRRAEMVANAVQLASAGEMVLCFVSSKAECHRTAREVARALNLAPAAAALERLGALPETVAGRWLFEVLQCGVAVHHADLATELRALVEDAVRAGELRVLVATGTLAMGVNLPADSVLISPRRWHEADGRWDPTALSSAEFESMAGRAGRLRPGAEQPFGRAAIVAASPIEREALLAAYIASQAGAPPARPQRDRLALYLLRLALAGNSLAAARDDGQGAEERTAAEELLTDAGLVVEGRPTELGRAAAAVGLGPTEAAGLARLVEAADSEPARDWLLYGLSSIRTLRNALPASAQGNHKGRPYAREWAQRTIGDACEERLAETAGGLDEDAARRAAVLDDWLSDQPTVQVEGRHRVLAGAIARLAQEAGHLAAGAARLASLVRPQAEQLSARLWRLSFELSSGGPASAASLGRVAPRGTPRDVLAALAREGIATVAAVVAAGPAGLAQHIPAWLVEPMFRRALACSRTSDDAALPWQALDTGQPVPRGDEPDPPSPILRIRRARPTEAVYRGRTVALTQKQFDLLAALAEHPGEFVSWDSLYEALWNEGLEAQPAQIGYHKRLLLGRIRAAAGPDAARELVTSVRGRGLMLNLAADEVDAV